MATVGQGGTKDSQERKIDRKQKKGEKEKEREVDRIAKEEGAGNAHRDYFGFSSLSLLALFGV